ncbi:MAG: hypothetical protein EXR77_15665 [Myxococcales bacterium]|nr:hypothetical protein [Myxococcales bacterium]
MLVSEKQRFGQFVVRASLLVCLSAVAATTGCVVNNHGNQGPALTVRWTTAGGVCSALSVAQVKVNITQANAIKNSIVAPCDSGEVQIAVATGSYQVQAIGLGATGEQVAVSTVVSVQVIANGVTTSPTLVLAASAASAVGSLAVGWTVQGQTAAVGCPAAGITKVVVTVFNNAQQKALGAGSVDCKAGQILLTNLELATGVYLQLDGYLATDADGKPSYGNPKMTGEFTLAAATTTAAATPIDLVKLTAGPTATGKGNISVSWTVLGESAATACAKRGLNQVYIRALNDKRAELASTVASCQDGAATLAGVPVGTGYVQLDATGPAAPASWGNVNVAGPFVLKDGRVVSPPKAIDIGQRTVVSLDWVFESGSCLSTGVQTVFVEVRDSADKVVIPMQDAWAGKPCDLTPLASYDARVLDLGFSQPQCAIPPGAKGLVLCNISGAKIGLHLSGVDAKNQPIVGGSMQISPITAGHHVALPVQLQLASCTAQAPCKKP